MLFIAGHGFLEEDVCGRGWTWMVVGIACFMYDGNVVACTSRLCHGRV